MMENGRKAVKFFFSLSVVVRRRKEVESLFFSPLETNQKTICNFKSPLLFMLPKKGRSIKKGKRKSKEE